MFFRSYIFVPLFLLSVGFDLTGVSASATAIQSRKDPQSSINRTIKEFLFATYSGNTAEYQKWILPEAGSDELITKRDYSDQELKDLRAEADSVNPQQVS